MTTSQNLLEHTMDTQSLYLVFDLFSILHLMRAMVPAELKDILLCISLEEELRLCFMAALLFDCLCSVPAFLCSLKIINYWDLFKGKHCDQAWIPNWLLFCQKSHSWFCLSRGTPTPSAYRKNIGQEKEGLSWGLGQCSWPKRGQGHKLGLEISLSHPKRGNWEFVCSY